MQEQLFENHRQRSNELLSTLSRQSAWLCIVSAGWYWKMGFLGPLAVDAATLLIYAFCAFLLHERRHPVVVRWLFFTATTGCLLANSLNLGDEALVWLFFFPLMSGVSLFFPVHQPRHALGIQVMIGAAVTVIAVAHFGFSLQALEAGVTPEFQRAFSAFSVVGATLTLLTLVHMNRRQEKEFQEKLERRSKQLFQAEKFSSLGIMSGGVAHEINNPLAAISLQLELMELHRSRGRIDDTTGEIKNGIERMQRMCRRISLIVTSLRNYAHTDSANSPKEIPMAEAMEQTLSLLEAQLKYKSIAIESRFSEAATVVCDRAGLMHILVSLITNSADAIEALDEKWIRVEGRETDDGYEIAVVDSGHGIPSDRRGKIFLPFYTTKGVGQGIGLGLSLSQTIAESNGGRLSYDESSERTRFVFTLPKKNAPETRSERKSA